MSKIVEIKKMWNEDLGRKTPIMFLDCGHGFVHTSNQVVGDTVYCTKCVAEGAHKVRAAVSLLEADSKRANSNA